MRLIALRPAVLLIVVTLVGGEIPQAAGHPHHDHHEGHPPASSTEQADGTSPSPAEGSQASAQQQPAERQEPTFLFDEGGIQIALELVGETLWYDGDILASESGTLMTGLEYNPERGDQIWIGSSAPGIGDHTFCSIPDIFGAHVFAAPTLTRDSSGQLWLSCEAEVEDQWNIFVSRINEEVLYAEVPQDDEQTDEQIVAETFQISAGVGADIHHRVVADTEGGLWVVWQSDVQGQFDILARHLPADQLTQGELTTEPIAVSTQPRGDWHPQVAVKQNGDVVFVWDAYNGESYNVYARILHDQQLGDMIPVAASEAFEGRAQVVVDHQQRTWLAWEEGGDNWGKPFRGRYTRSVREELGPLHRFRQLHVALLNDENQVQELSDPLPMPSIEQAQQREAVSEDHRRTGAFYERARLAVDSAGRVWIAYRHFYAPWIGCGNRSHVEGGWMVYTRYYGENGWSLLQQFSGEQGDGIQRLELTPYGDGIACLWTVGRTDRRPVWQADHRQERPVGMAKSWAEAEENEAAASEIPLSEAVAWATPSADPPCEAPAPETVASTEYQLFFGDLHRHTDLSLCRVSTDGTIDDAYRYASDVAELDFLAITDHSRDLALGDALSLLWWRNRKEVSRHELDDQFFPFYAYERSHDETADHNVISLRDDMLRPYTYPLTEFWEELDDDTFTIPHQPIRRETWYYQDDDRRPLAEIFQGCRDTSLEEEMHEALNRGYHLGFIASSDHLSTSSAYACVWAEDTSRESIFRSMQARRTFGATSKIRLVVRAGDHWMGEIFEAEEMPPVTLQATAEVPIRQVDLVVDGIVTKTLSPHERSIDIIEQLDLTGSHYLYFYLRLADGNEAWSSPLWVNIGSSQGE